MIIKKKKKKQFVNMTNLESTGVQRLRCHLFTPYNMDESLIVSPLLKYDSVNNIIFAIFFPVVFTRALKRNHYETRNVNKKTYESTRKWNNETRILISDIYCMENLFSFSVGIFRETQSVSCRCRATTNWLNPVIVGQDRFN